MNLTDEEFLRAIEAGDEIPRDQLAARFAKILDEANQEPECCGDCEKSVEHIEHLEAVIDELRRELRVTKTAVNP